MSMHLLPMFCHFYYSKILTVLVLGKQVCIGFQYKQILSNITYSSKNFQAS